MVRLILNVYELLLNFLAIISICKLALNDVMLQIAKAVANATTAAFITMVGSEFVQKYLGEGITRLTSIYYYFS